MTRTILIVDDNAVDRTVLQGFLKQDYTVIEAASGNEMISILRTKGETISAILLDLVMPEMDGFEALREMRDNAVYRQIPVIVASGQNDENTQVRALSLGAAGFAFKPYNREILLHMLENTINLREKSALANTFNMDTLTGLLNRRAFFQQAADLVRRHEAGYYVLTCFDVENFKVINDQYGIDTGDRILKHIAERVNRSITALGGICCHDAADKFGMLYPASYVASDEIKQLYEAVMATELIGHSIKIRVGRYFVDDIALPVNAMYDRATIAEESIKGRYDTYIAEYTEEMRRSLVKEQQMVNDMDRALASGEFEPWFQPQYNHATGAMIGAEALVRWRRDGKIVTPNDFIPVFERNGFIYEVDQYIWRRVCILLRRWLDEGKNPLPVSVNISRCDLLQKDFMDRICSLTEEYRLPPDLLRLEVTESAFTEATNTIYAVVNELIDRGFTVEIDDFGSGYSSLNTLKDVPASILKLDMRFFEKTGDAKRGGNIIESVVRMAKWLGMAVIAEGVEEKARADYLKSIGCFYIQGYLYAKPMPVEEYEKRLDTSAKEAQLTRLQTLQNLDNNNFWDSRSMDTLIFNSYVGAACILEYYKGRIEMVRATDMYITMLGTASMNVSDALKHNWASFMDMENICRFSNAVMESVETKKTVSEELVFTGIPGCPHKVYLIVGLRAIATVGDRILVYCLNNNITAQREAEQQRLESARRLEIITNNVNGGVSAIKIRDDGTSEFVFNNSKYFALYGYTREQAQAENLDIMRLIQPEDFDAVMEKIHELKEDKKPVIIDYSIKKRDGRRALLRANASLTSFPGYGDDVIASVITDITEQRSLEDQLHFLNNSAHDILTQSDSEQAIRRTLTNLITYFAAERGYVIELDERNMVLNNTYEVCADDIEPEIENWQSIPYTTSDYWYESLSQNKFFVIENASAMDDSQSELREMLLSQNIHAIILAPLWRDGHLIAFAGVDNPKNTVHQMEPLKVLADYCTALLARRDLLRKIEHDSEAVQQLMDDTPGGFLRLRILPDNTPAIVGINAGFCRMLGMTPDEVMASYRDDAFKCLLAEDMAAVKNTTAEALAGSDAYTYKCRLRKKDGTLIWVQVFGRYVRDENGDLFRNAYFTDITEKLTAEENQRALLDNLPFGAAMYEFDGKRLKALYINRQYQRMVGRTRNSANLAGYLPTDFIHPDDRAVTLNAIKDAIDNHRDGSCNIRVRYGEDEYRSFHIDARIMALPDGEYLVYAAYTRISEQELTFENALPHMFSTVMESSTDLAFAKDINFRYICCSKTFAMLLGLQSEKEVVGKTDYELFPKEIADMFRRDDSTLFATQKPQIDVQEMLPSPDGTKHYIRTSKHLMRSDTDTIIGIYCIGRDVTEIREAYARLRLLTDSIPGGIATFRCTRGKLETVYFNDGICTLAGYSREEYEAHPVPLPDLIFVEDRPVVREQIALLESGEKYFNFIVRIHTKNGGYKWVNAVATAVDHVGDVYSISAVLTDVTEQQEEKERLRLAEEEYRIATEHSARTICRYNIADRSLRIAHEAAARFTLPLIMQEVPYSQIKDGSVSIDTAENYLAFYEGILRGKKEGACVFCKKLQNRWRWLSAHSTSIFDLSGKPVSAIISFRDITEEQEKEIIFKKWEQSLTERKPEQFTLFRCNLNKDASYDTKEGTLFGFSVEDTKEKMFNECTADFCNQYVAEEDRSRYMELLDSDRLLANYYRGVRSGELIFRAKLDEDDVRWVRLSLDLLEYPDSTDVEAYLMYEDINDSVLEELHIKKLAETDSLTGLQNRKIFIERVNGLMGHSGMNANRTLFLLDIDGFKLINDHFGHSAGDKFIIDIANAIRSVIPEDGFACRLGGDEFLVYLPGMPGRDAVADKARELCEVTHITVKDKIQVSVSIGIALVTDEGEDFDTMYHKADKALYHVKGHGKNNFAFYEADMERDDDEVISDVLCGPLASLADGKNTMLVVDDSAINRMVTAGMFKNDFTIAEAENGQVALDYLREHSGEVAIVLLDIMMPVMDGYELLSVMKTEPPLQEIPVIVISGEDDRKASLRAIKAGASEYIVKPVDAELLRLRVSSALSKSENGRLRKQNDDYAVDNQELHSYRSLMDSNATVLVEYAAGTGIFKYAPKTGDYLSGTFDARPIWQIFTDDGVASDADAEAIRQMITASKKPCKAVFPLMTPDGTAHPFLMKVILRDAAGNDDVILITLTDRK